MDSILITGGAGFIGSHLVDYYLSNSNFNIIILDNLNSYYDPNRKKKNMEEIKIHNENHRFIFIKGDIRDKRLIKKIFSKFKIKIVFHLAAMAGVRYSIDHPHLYIDVNINGTLNLLEVSKTTKVKSFIFASSSSVYGNTSQIPFYEDMNVDKPISPYAATKKTGEELCYLYHYLFDLNITCLRFFSVYGPRGRPDMAAYKFIENIYKGEAIIKYGDGNTYRDYTYIDDIIRGIVLAAKKNYPFEIFNLGNGKTTNLNEFIKIIEEVTNRVAKINQLPKQAGDVDKTYASIIKAKNLLDYYPKIQLKEGITRMFDWYVKNT